MKNTFTLNGNTMTLSPLTLGDLVQFKVWVQWKPYEDFRSQKQRFDPRDFAEELAKLRGECARKRLVEGSGEVVEAQQSYSGIVKMLQLSLLKQHPGITEAELETLTIGQLYDISDQLQILSGLVDEEEEVPTAKKNRKAR